MQESLKTYDLINGIKKNVENMDLRKNESANKLLEISWQKYELLHGISNINKPKLNNEEERRGGDK